MNDLTTLPEIGPVVAGQLVAGGVLALTTIVMLAFYIKHHIDSHSAELGTLKALGYSSWRVAADYWVFAFSVFIGTVIGYGIGYRPVAWVGFLLGSAYQYGLMRTIISLTAGSLGVATTRFNILAFIVSGVSFLILYELFLPLVDQARCIAGQHGAGVKLGQSDRLGGSVEADRTARVVQSSGSLATAARPIDHHAAHGRQDARHPGVDGPRTILHASNIQQSADFLDIELRTPEASDCVEARRIRPSGPLERWSCVLQNADRSSFKTVIEATSGLMTAYRPRLIDARIAGKLRTSGGVLLRGARQVGTTTTALQHAASSVREALINAVPSESGQAG